MYEYLSEAIVLNRRPTGEQDERMELFTKRYGKITCFGKSTRKITSKLSPHLQPGMHSRIRIIERKSTHIVDALLIARLAIPSLHLSLLSSLLTEKETHPSLWHVLTTGEFNWRQTLRWLGWDPAGAQCIVCKSRKAHIFQPTDQTFLCRPCALNKGKKAVSYTSDVAFN